MGFIRYRCHNYRQFHVFFCWKILRACWVYREQSVYAICQSTLKDNQQSSQRSVQAKLVHDNILLQSQMCFLRRISTGSQCHSVQFPQNCVSSCRCDTFQQVFFYLLSFDYCPYFRLNTRYGIAGTPTLLLWINGVPISRMDDRELNNTGLMVSHSLADKFKLFFRGS